MTSDQLNAGSQSFTLPGSSFGYTGIPVDQIETQDNTLVVSGFDQSGSTHKNKHEMEDCIKSIIQACGRCADKLIYRQVHFDDQIIEYHGYKPLVDCHISDYDNCWSGGGQTNLYGACENILEAVIDYSEQQAAQRYTVNGIVYIITDGMHFLPGDKQFTKERIKIANEKALASESLESLITILVGITNGSQSTEDQLREFSDFVGFTTFETIDNADEKSLAKLANFISASVNSQSKAVGSGSASKPLSLNF